MQLRLAVSASDLRLEFWPIDRIVPSARNARSHSEAQVAEIAGSIRSFGFVNPLLVGEGGALIAGHGRLEAARKLGLSEVPVIELHGLSELQQRQLMLADNRIALNAGWDIEMLHLELKDLAALGADLKILGFAKGELAKALTPADFSVAARMGRNSRLGRLLASRGIGCHLLPSTFVLTTKLRAPKQKAASGSLQELGVLLS